MENNLKTFRLFISSTFSDFQVEREALQTKVFPEIKEYCFSKGYTFQPIDLRWGVSEEAQLDQKALEMCIKEVQSCKRYDYPNFLIMLGDRYGWIPLPNIIEKSEFEQILQNIDEKDKEYILSWYFEDANQVPASYMLEQRTDEYEDYNKWLEIETKLRDILQTAVSSLSEDIKKKYFTSATEAEAIEGIISYSQKSEFQQKLLKLIPDLEQIDHRNIFGFFRDIEQSSVIEDKFVSTDYDKAQLFKQEVQEKLIDENILNVYTSQISKDKLDEKYLDTFIQSATNFLKQQVDKQIANDSEQDYSDLELEKLQQHFFMNQKLENFLGQEKVLTNIQDYINNDNCKPLVICGQSGIGKSSIIAKAIEDTSNQTSKKIIYRFIGATPNSTSTIDLLNSILDELNVETVTELKENEPFENYNEIGSTLVNEENKFIDFSNKVYDVLISLQDDIVIFIDAIDQLTNDDQFLWLPNKLSPNVKIIISTLQDEEYKEDSKYFYILESKISSYIEIDPFNKPIELLKILLSKNNRTLQLNQKEYFLEQYNQVKTPLYVYMAANQMHCWKSNSIVDADVSLSFPQKDIVKSFIENLTSIHHHDKLLVQKVFGYILASKDGLSEYEILELLNTDKEFIKAIAPNTWHQNITQELPLVIWTRLYNHIKPFLSKKRQDGQELLYFFHREFIGVIENQIDQQKEHEKILEATQELILKHQNENFNNNRWGKLYANLIVEYCFKVDENQLRQKAVFISELINEQYIEEFYGYCAIQAFRCQLNRNFHKSSIFFRISYFCAKAMYEKKPFKDTVKYNLKMYQYAPFDSIRERLGLGLDPDVLGIVEDFVDKSLWTRGYMNSIANLSASLRLENKMNESLSLQEESSHLAEVLYDENPYLWADTLINSLAELANIYNSLGNKQRALDLLIRNNSILEKFYESENRDLYIKPYVTNLNQLSKMYNAFPLERNLSLKYAMLAMNIIEDLYIENNNDWEILYILILIQASMAHINMNEPYTGIDLLEGNLHILEEVYKKNPKYYTEIYISYLINLSIAYSSNKMNTLAIDILIKLLNLVEELFYKNHMAWLSKYIVILGNLATASNEESQLYNAKEYSLKVINLYKEFNFNNENLRNYINCCMIISEVYFKKGDFENALEYGLEAISNLNLIDYKSDMSLSLLYLQSINTVGMVYFQKKHIDKALEYYEKAVHISEHFYILDSKLYKNYLDSLQIVIQIFASKNKLKEVVDYMGIFENILNDVKMEESSKKYLVIYLLLAKYYVDDEDENEKAYESYNKYIESYEELNIETHEIANYIMSLFMYYSTAIKGNKDTSKIENFIRMKHNSFLAMFGDDYLNVLNQVDSILQQQVNRSSSEKANQLYAFFLEVFMNDI